jgi:hypothetical protein
MELNKWHLFALVVGAVLVAILIDDVLEIAIAKSLG